ncbi:MAG: mannose-6-phosphate isomerase, class I [Actinomycetota bacterium]
MAGVRTVAGVVQHYAWGDSEFLPRLLGREPDGRPWAELWLGTHPRGQARLDGEPLADTTGRLPYLLKVLCAAEPLSMQCHPDADRAAAGHAAGVYPDPYAKPELIVALTPFRALCGLRPTESTLDLLDASGADTLAEAIRSDGLAGVIEQLYRGRLDHRSAVAAAIGSDVDGLAYVADLERRYPGDPSVAVAMLLNHVTLEPGQALHLTAGNLHAYLRGSGIELMGASDNVVRGGLTVKHVDVDELLTIVDPTPLERPVMPPAAGRYALPEAGVELRRIDPGTEHHSTGHELAVALDGTTVYLPPGSSWRPEVAAYAVVSGGRDAA